MASRGIVTQSELARLAGVHRVVLNRLLTGKHDPDIATIAKIAQALNCEPWELLREDSKPIVEEPTIPEVLSLLQLYEGAPKEAREYARYVLEHFGRSPPPGRQGPSSEKDESRQSGSGESESPVKPPKRSAPHAVAEPRSRAKASPPLDPPMRRPRRDAGPRQA